jgi:cytochrome b561
MVGRGRRVEEAAVNRHKYTGFPVELLLLLLLLWRRQHRPPIRRPHPSVRRST